MPDLTTLKNTDINTLLAISLIGWVVVFGLIALNVLAPLIRSRTASDDSQNKQNETFLEFISQDRADRRADQEQKRKDDEQNRLAQSKFIETLAAMKDSIEKTAAQAASAILPEVTNLQHQLDERAKTNADLARENSKLILENTAELKAFHAEFNTILDKLSPLIRAEVAPILDKLQPLLIAVETSKQSVIELDNKIMDVEKAVLDAITRISQPTATPTTNSVNVTVAPPTADMPTEVKP